jgi:general secretion pathway protein I
MINIPNKTPFRKTQAIPAKANKLTSGFTLLEVMVSLAIIAIVLVSLLISQSRSVSLQDETKFNTTATLLAQKKVSEIEAKKDNDLASDSGDFGEDFPNYSWEVTVQDVTLAGADITLSGAEEFTKYLKQVDLKIHRGDNKHYQYAIRLYKFIP